MAQSFFDMSFDHELAASSNDAARSSTLAGSQIDAWFAVHASGISAEMMAAVQPFLRTDGEPASMRRMLDGHLGVIISATTILPSLPLRLREIGNDIARACAGRPVALAAFSRALRGGVLDAMPPPMAASIESAFEHILAEIAWGYAVSGEAIEQDRRETPPSPTSSIQFDLDWLAAVADQSPFALAIHDVSQGRLIAGNATLTTMFGYSLEEFDRISASELFGPEAPDGNDDVFIQLAAGVVSQVRRISALRHKDGHMVWFEMVAWLVRNADGVPCRIAYTFTPQVDLIGMGEQWQQADARFRYLSQLSPDPILLVKPEGRILYASPAVASTLGLEPEDAPGMAFEELVLEEDHPQLGPLFEGGIERARTQVRQRARLQRRDGEWRWFELSSVNLLDVPNLEGFAVQARDISERIAVEALLSRQAFVDELTGLPNRRAATEYIEAALEREAADGDEYRLCVMFLDLNRFKLINDRHGHQGGDVVLAEIGRRLLVELRKHTFVARFGGDEFVACLERTTLNRAMRVAQRLLRHVAEPFEIEGHLQTVSAEIGLAMSSPDLRDVASLVHGADQALYIAKRQGAGVPVVHEAAQNTSEFAANVPDQVI